MRTIRLSLLALALALIASAPAPAGAPDKEVVIVNARQAVQVAGSVSNNGSLATLYTVPAGKRLVIEFMSANAPVPAGGSGFMILRTNLTDLGPLEHAFALTASGTFGALTRLLASERVQIYANPETDVEAAFFCTNCVAGGPTMGVTISGYLIDFP
jgi:hypothetical protein